MKLKAKDPGRPVSLPGEADELMNVLCKEYMSYLNFEMAQLVVRYLKDEDLNWKMKGYEENVEGKVQTTLKECRNNNISPVRPPNCGHISITADVDSRSYSLHRILQMKEFLVDKIGLNRALFVGWSRGSVTLHFYIALEEMKMAEQIMKLPEVRVDLQSFHVTKVRFSLDVPKGEPSEVRIEKSIVLTAV